MDLGLVLAVVDQVIFGQAELLGDLDDRFGLGGLGDVQVGRDGG